MPLNVTMPALSPTMDSGTLAKWLVKKGDTVAPGDVIAEIETDKATMEVEAVEEGTVARLLVEEGTENVAVNTPIAILLEEGEGEEDLAGFESGAGDSITPPEKTSSENPGDTAPEIEKKDHQKESRRKDEIENSSSPSPGKPETPALDSPGTSRSRVFSSPLARRLAANNNIDIDSIKGSGPHGRIVKQDVEKAAAGAATQPTPKERTASQVQQRSEAQHKAPQLHLSSAQEEDVSSPPARQLQEAGTQSGSAGGAEAKKLADTYGMSYRVEKNSGMRKTIAKRLLESKQTVPHYYLSIECQIDNLLEARQQMNAQSGGSYKLSVNDFLVKACAMALKSYPQANVAWTQEEMIYYDHAYVSVAVATPAGLITPIIKKAETKGLIEISKEVKDLAGRAREGKLKPHEYQGGTFSLSNLGMYGIDEFSAIINPPQAAIFAVGAGIQKPYVKNGDVQVGTFMKGVLSCDHRAIDGAVGAEYLSVLRSYIENPVSMLL